MKKILSIIAIALLVPLGMCAQTETSTAEFKTISYSVDDDGVNDVFETADLNILNKKMSTDYSVSQESQYNLDNQDLVEMYSVLAKTMELRLNLLEIENSMLREKVKNLESTKNPEIKKPPKIQSF